MVTTKHHNRQHAAAAAPDEREPLVASQSLNSQVTNSDNYGTVTNDLESTHHGSDDHHSDNGNGEEEQEEERYSRTFVAQVVGALLIGENLPPKEKEKAGHQRTEKRGS